MQGNLRLLLIFTITAITSFTLGYLLHSPDFPQIQNLIEDRNPQGYKFINPLLDCNLSNFNSTNLNDLKSQFLQIVDKYKSQNKLSFASVYYRDLNNGPWVGINEKETFSPASLMKVPLLISYLKIADNNPQFLDQKLTFNPDSKALYQSVLPQITLTPNQQYTIKELIERMIIYSDNQATNLLYNNLDPKLLDQTFKDLGVETISTVDADNISSLDIKIKDYASFFRILFNASYLSKPMSESALSILSQVNFTDGLVANLPKDIKISHKFGERFLTTGEKQLHDCGIIYLPRHPYLLCVMSRGTEFPKLSEFIKEISNSTYQYLSTDSE